MAGLARATVLSRSNPQVSLKRLDKRGYRLVTDGCRDRAQLGVARAQPLARCVQPEAGQVSQRRLAHPLRETRGETGSREGGTICKRRNRPLITWLSLV